MYSGSTFSLLTDLTGSIASTTGSLHHNRIHNTGYCASLARWLKGVHISSSRWDMTSLQTRHAARHHQDILYSILNNYQLSWKCIGTIKRFVPAPLAHLRLIVLYRTASVGWRRKNTALYCSISAFIIQAQGLWCRVFCFHVHFVIRICISFESEVMIKGRFVITSSSG